MDQKSFVSIASNYFKRFPYLELPFDYLPHPDLALVIVIPVFDEKDVLPTLRSLFQEQDSVFFHVEIIAVVNNAHNSSIDIKEQNMETHDLLKEFALNHNNEIIKLISFLVDDLSPKHAGVGWARKIGMDFALKRFQHIEKNGVIIGLDADTVVERNYLNSIYSHFKSHDNTAVSIHFEHPLDDDRFSSFHQHCIICYELHLRYYKNALQYVGFPFAFHTIGSAFALLASAYARQGGMNRRKAGEDFYFINKLIKGENFGEISSTKVMPSPRLSNRVPFGTGRAILEAHEKKKDLSLTYSFDCFKDLKAWLSSVKSGEVTFINFPLSIQQFLGESNWKKSIEELNRHTNNHTSFMKRFYALFDAFWVLKFVHFYRDNIMPISNLKDNVNSLLLESKKAILKTELDQLIYFRLWDKKRGPKEPL